MNKATGLPAEGLDSDEIRARLTAFRENDLAWRSGKLWAYVYPPPEHVAVIQKHAFLEYLTENGLDPTAFPSLVAMENGVLDFCRAHLSGDDQVVGSFTTGGTESCLLAVKTARDAARARGIATPQMIIPVTAHAAFYKAAHYFDIDLVVVPVNWDTFRVEPAAIEAALTPNTALIVASAPSYAHGVIDPIEAIGAIAAKHGTLFHVDGCIGAFLLPFLKKLGEPVPAFDFAVPGVTSISMDLHKYAYCPKGASVVLYRNAALRAHQYFACASWTGYTMINPTILSSKSGGAVASAWATLHAFGERGYLDAARAILEARRAVTAGIASIDGLRVLGTPDASLVAFTTQSPELSVFHIADEMSTRGYMVQVQLAQGGGKENLHLSLLPQSQGEAPEFLAALAEAVSAARALAFGPLVTMVQAMAPQLAATTPTLETVHSLLAGAGIDPRGLPGRMADMNQVMNLLPPAWREMVLVHVVGSLFHP